MKTYNNGVAAGINVGEIMADKIILTLYSRLEAKYDAYGVADIEAKLDEYVKADAARGLTTRILYADYPHRTGFGVSGVTLDFPDQSNFPPDEVDEQLDDWIREVNRFARAIKAVVNMAWKEWNFDYLMIVGGNDVVPFFRAENPLRQFSRDELDTTVPTDNPYGFPSLIPELDMYYFLLPELPVGRIPDIEASNDPAYLISILSKGIEQAGRECRGEALIPSGWGLTAEIWEALSKYLAMKNQIPPSHVEVAPPIGLSSFPTTLYSGSNVHYFNVHGALGTGIWYGESNKGIQDPVFGPAQIQQGSTLTAGMGVVTEACYGADILGRPMQQSCALTYLANSCSTFVGSSTIAYGSIAPPATCADLIAKDFLDFLMSGVSTGSSLLHAKQNLANTTSPYGGLTPSEIKTLFQFSLLGDPSHHPFQGKVHKRLETVKTRREALQEISVTLRNFLLPVIQAKSVRLSETPSDAIPEVGQVWLREIEARLPDLLLSGEQVEVLSNMQIKSLANLKSSVQEVQRVIAVHRLYVDPTPLRVSDPQARFPKPMYAASAYFAENRLLRESVVKSH